MIALDSLISNDHPARLIWELIDTIDLKVLNEDIKSRKGYAGRRAIDRKILLALWIYAYSRGIGSGREIHMLCSQDNAFRWICGGQNINYHTIDDFRSKNGEKFQEIIKEIISVIMKEGIIDVSRITVDGTRIKTKASDNKRYKEKRLEEYVKDAKKHIKEVDQLAEKNNNLSKLEISSKKRAAREKLEKEKNALNQLKEIKKNKYKNTENSRISVTENDCRTMKPSRNEGYMLAYNVQVASETKEQFIVGVKVNNKPNDSNGLKEVIPEVERNTRKKPDIAITDAGYPNYHQIDYMDKTGIKYYSAVDRQERKRKELKNQFVRENSHIN
jgi:transposase